MIDIIEILFKGKRIDNGEWVEGCYMTDEKNKSTAYIGHIFGVDDSVLIHDMDFAQVFPETVCQYTNFTDKTKWEELSESEKKKFLSEWNYKEGKLNTKENWNGRKIWAHDIVEFEDTGEEGYEYKEGFDFKNRAEVVYENGRVKFSSFLSNNSGVLDLMNNYPDEFYETFEDCKVIGNIFDDKKLLKWGNDEIKSS